MPSSAEECVIDGEFDLFTAYKQFGSIVQEYYVARLGSTSWLAKQFLDVPTPYAPVVRSMQGIIQRRYLPLARLLCHGDLCRSLRRLTHNSTYSFGTLARSQTMDPKTRQLYLADAPPNVVKLDIRSHFEALTDKQKRYAHHISRSA